LIVGLYPVYKVEDIQFSQLDNNIYNVIR
jgi:hypothetical protein